MFFESSAKSGESAKNLNNSNGPVVLKLNYPLSKEQKEISDQILDNYNKKIDTLVNAVCGAGKTELVYKVIGKCMASGKTVAFAVPRRDVVIELFMRIKEAFPFNKCVAVYGSHTSQLEGDIVVLTTHQFYRYNHYFDLIILDEIDAFPFKNNDVLKTMFERAKRGSVVLMSATPSREVLLKDVIVEGNYKTKDECYKDKAFFVMSSILEGLGLVLLEAKYYNLPIISTDCYSGPSDIIQNGIDGYLVENRNEFELATKIEELISNQELRIQMSSQSKNILKEYNKDKIVGEWLKLLAK